MKKILKLITLALLITLVSCEKSEVQANMDTLNSQTEEVEVVEPAPTSSVNYEQCKEELLKELGGYGELCAYHTSKGDDSLNAECEGRMALLNRAFPSVECSLPMEDNNAYIITNDSFEEISSIIFEQRNI